MPISRETASSDSPRNSRMTISRLRVALQRWMTFGPAFSPGPVGSFGLFFGFSIGPSIWTIRCPTSSTADHAREPGSESRPLYAGRRLPSHQAPGRLVPGDRAAPGFDDGSLANDASSKGSLSFVSLTHTCSRYLLELFLQRSPPRLLTAAAWSGLRPAPESRSRGAHPHLSRSLSTRSIRSS